MSKTKYTQEEVDQMALDSANEIHRRIRLLYRRYNECDKLGHQLLDKDKNYCNYCFRHLEYKSPKTDKILEERSRLPDMLDPADAPLIVEKRTSEIRCQKITDFFNGVMKIKKKDSQKKK
jgi:hypothetical protein